MNGIRISLAIANSAFPRLSVTRLGAISETPITFKEQKLVGPVLPQSRTTERYAEFLTHRIISSGSHWIKLTT